MSTATDPLPKILADVGYDGDAFAFRVGDEWGVTLEISLRPSGAKSFVLLPVRWVVERTFA